MISSCSFRILHARKLCSDLEGSRLRRYAISMLASDPLSRQQASRPRKVGKVACLHSRALLHAQWINHACLCMYLQMYVSMYSIAYVPLIRWPRPTRKIMSATKIFYVGKISSNLIIYRILSINPRILYFLQR
jgi:hypothetical protein